MAGQEDDLELKDMGHFTGTTQYTRFSIFKTVGTDGIGYVMQNGYSWFVTDVLAVIETKLKTEEFLSIKLKLDGSKGKMIITDGNNKILYTQDYGYTDAKVELNLYWADNVLMLTSEY